MCEEVTDSVYSNDEQRALVRSAVSAVTQLPTAHERERRAKVAQAAANRAQQLTAAATKQRSPRAESDRVSARPRLNFESDGSDT